MMKLIVKATFYNWTYLHQIELQAFNKRNYFVKKLFLPNKNIKTVCKVSSGFSFSVSFFTIMNHIYDSNQEALTKGNLCLYYSLINTGIKFRNMWDINR